MIEFLSLIFDTLLCRFDEHYIREWWMVYSRYRWICRDAILFFKMLRCDLLVVLVFILFPCSILLENYFHIYPIHNSHVQREPNRRKSVEEEYIVIATYKNCNFYLPKSRALATTTPFQQKLHLIYLINDVLHHWLVDILGVWSHDQCMWMGFYIQ